MTGYIFVDETKARGYVMAAVTVNDPAEARRLVHSLIQPGNRRLHLVDERPNNRPRIVSAVASPPITAVVYDAGRRYRTDRLARGACLEALAADIAGTSGGTRLFFEEDRTLVQFDQQCLIDAIRRHGVRGRLAYEHSSAHAEPPLALPDIAAWCWVRSGLWRRRIEPILRAVRIV